MELLSQIFVACGAQGPPPLIIGVGLEVFATPLLSPNPVKYMYPPIDSRKAAENYHFTANGFNSY